MFLLSVQGLGVFTAGSISFEQVFAAGHSDQLNFLQQVGNQLSRLL
jgi:hypothetical protein